MTRKRMSKKYNCSFLLIKPALIPIGPQEQTADPRRSLAHLITDVLRVDTGRAFYNQLVMHRADNETVPERLHGVSQDVPGNGLRQVLDHFWPIGFQPGPLAQVGAFVGHTAGTEAVHADARLDV